MIAGGSMFNFANQKILVIGGTSGIGLATARIAAESGATVTIASRSAGKVDAACAGIGRGVLGRQLDCTDDAAVENFFADGTVWNHVLVTASQVSIAAVRELPLNTARASFDSKFWGFYRVTRSAQIVPGGSLSVIAGFLATRPAAGRALMGAINGALESLVQGLALELKPVRVNAISPGLIATEMWSGMAPDAREAMFAKIAATYPAGRVGQPEDIAFGVLYLASPEAKFVTGSELVIDGGYTAR